MTQNTSSTPQSSSADQVHVTYGPDGIATLMLDNPGRFNSVTEGMIDTITRFAQEAAEKNSLHAVVIRGAGEHFCAGGDLDWLHSQVMGDDALRLKEAKRVGAMFAALEALPMPVIALVKGVAVGAGAGLAAIADITIAPRESRFSLPETKIGIVPGVLSPILAARMSPKLACAVSMTSEMMSGQTAYDAGLVTHLVAQDDLEAALEKQLSAILNLPRGPVAAAKKLSRPRLPDFEARVEEAALALATALGGAAAKEGITAFIEKRKPDWASIKE